VPGFRRPAPRFIRGVGTTIDHLSGARLEFGLGTSGAEAEHAMLGVPFPAPGERIRRLGEALTVAAR
jgi:alkanesulfonate monooxygenase SsuD/methylene tetrahydromethanopterin reductase-like flavin-dependent oxidoreductase (luciferase family)